MNASRRSRRTGVVAIYVAVALIALVGVAAISIDGGLLYLYLRDVRATADAAAMAAACELYKNYPTNGGKDPDGEAARYARRVARANGYADWSAESEVEVNIPPATGPYAGKDGYVEVTVTYNAPRAFSRIFGAAPIPVRARAVARGAWVSPNAGVIILDYDDKAALSSQGNGAFTETGGPVIINSNNPSAVVTTGNGKLIAEAFFITGGAALGGNATLETSPTPGQVYTGTHPTPDPLAYLPEPPVPTDGTITITNLGNGNKQYVLTPGRHTNLPTFNSGDVVLLKQASAGNDGIYYIDGGGFKSTGATITMDPSTSGGVLLYNKPAGNNQSEQIQITGNPNGVVNIEPLAEGPYAGMALWQQRTATVDVQIEGNGNFSINGTFYAKSALLKVAGNGKTSSGEPTGYFINDDGTKVNGSSRIGSQFVVNNLAMSGNGNITIYYKKTKAARTRIIALVE